jgi:hypothetical protein
MAQQPAPFTHKTLEAALHRLGELAAAQGKLVEVSVYGGSALLLTFPARAATRDVDAVFEGQGAFIRPAAAVVAAEFGLSPDWINDGVKGFLSARDPEPGIKSLFRTYPNAEDSAGVRVLIASPPYLFAMKAMAMRIGGTEASSDLSDLRQLGKHLGIDTYQQAIELVAGFYPNGRISPKTQFGLQEIFGS